jgi:3-dehydroquinate synthase
VTNATQTVRVNLAERSYDIQIGADILSHAGQSICRQGRVSHVVVLTDQNVEKPHGVSVAESLAEADLTVDMVVVEPGEPSKAIGLAVELWEKMLQLGADRKTVVVAVGGGVVGDLGGFIAATYARGIRFFQVPTSLLAQVDSSVGGKVGINLPEAKNMVGAFLQPVGVLIDTQTLQTLDKRQYLAGLGEIVKHGVALDPELFDYLEEKVESLLARDHDVMGHVIAWNCRLKAGIVERDEREETGLRAALNYGHTFGHALEALSGYGELLHGEGVSIGMLCASRLAERLGRIDAEFTARQHRLLSALGLPTELPSLDHDQILRTMMHDKKVEHGRLRFVLPVRMGQVELVGDIDPRIVREAMAG